MSEVSIHQNRDLNRFEAHVGGELAGFAEYELEAASGDRPDLIVFTHTEVDDAFEGRGVGSSLAREALDAVRRDGTRRVVPRCPFIKDWIRRHPDYRDLVA